jgi:hypothetical protein
MRKYVNVKSHLRNDCFSSCLLQFTAQNRQSARLSLQSSELAPSPRYPQASVAPPPPYAPRGGAYSLAVEGAGGANPDEETVFHDDINKLFHIYSILLLLLYLRRCRCKQYPAYWRRCREVLPPCPPFSSCLAPRATKTTGIQSEGSGGGGGGS